RRVQRGAEEVVGRGVAHVKLDRGVQRGQVHQVRLAQDAVFDRRRGGECAPAQLFNRAERAYGEGLAVLAVQPATPETDVGRHDLGCPAFAVAAENQLFVGIEAEIGE